MDEARLVEIYRDSVRPLYATVSRWADGDRARTEDIVQETFLRAVRAWQDKGEPDEPLAWLRTVARNLLVSETRKRRPEADEEAAESALAPERPLDREERLAIGNGLDALPSGQAELLRAFHMEGHTTRELAQVHGISERAIEGRLRRARHALRRLLERTDRPEETSS